MPSQSKDDHSLHSQQQRVGNQYSKETPRKIFIILYFRVPLLQSSKPDTTFQFGQVMDVHMFAISPLSLFANNDYFPNGYSPVYNTTWMRLSPPLLATIDHFPNGCSPVLQYHLNFCRCWTGLLVEKSTSSEQRYCNISTCHKPRSIHIHQQWSYLHIWKYGCVMVFAVLCNCLMSMFE